MGLNVIVICVKKKVEIHDKMEYLPTYLVKTAKSQNLSHLQKHQQKIVHNYITKMRVPSGVSQS